jgi:hypothetical protein
MRLPTNPNIRTVQPELLRLLRDITNQVNAITEGQGYAFHAAMTTAPTTLSWAVGDFVKNSAPAEVGTGGMKYVITGWQCTASGTPGTWVECRALTGGGVDFTKLLTATATLDFASIAAGATAELTITVTGAATGDFVILAAPSGIEAGLMWTGFVSAADTVKIRLHNTTGGAVDPASASWKATVMTFA